MKYLGQKKFTEWIGKEKKKGVAVALKKQGLTVIHPNLLNPPPYLPQIYQIFPPLHINPTHNALKIFDKMPLTLSTHTLSAHTYRAHLGMLQLSWAIAWCHGEMPLLSFFSSRDFIYETREIISDESIFCHFPLERYHQID